MTDRVGLGWRGELAASILCRMDALDVVEVIAEDWLHAGHREIAALRGLARSMPVLLHGVSLGLASTIRADARRLDRMAQLVGRVQPLAWSEHLAFVRAGGIEIGHLAAPPRTRAVIDGTLANLATARRIVGSQPCMENIATLLEPPGSDLTEAQWIHAIANAADVPLLLDLHNLYANAVNFGVAPEALLCAMPLDRVAMVHLSGGVWIPASTGARRLLDDHLHDVPDEVYALLETTARLVERPLTVIIERDGNYPEFDVQLQQVERAREAMRRGRAARAALARRAA